MMTFGDIEALRRQADAVAFAKAWICESKDPSLSCDHVLNLTIWQESHPHKALGLILNLIEQAGEDEAVEEMIAMGPATGIVEETDDSFSLILKEAIATYPKFALFTKWQRENSNDAHW